MNEGKITSSITLNITFTTKNTFRPFITDYDKLDQSIYNQNKGSIRIVNLMYNTLKQHLYTEFNINNTYIKSTKDDIKKLIGSDYNTKSKESFSSFDTILAVKHFKKKNSLLSVNQICKYPKR